MTSPMHPFSQLPSQAASPPHLSAQAVRTAGQRAVGMSGPTRILLSLLAMGGGYALIKDTVSGTNMKRQDAIAAAKEHAEWADMENGWAHWSGMPWMDKTVHQAKRFVLFGPWNLRLKWQAFTINFNSWVNDVFLPNLLPFTLMAGGAISLIGAGRLRNGTMATGRFIRNYVHIPPGFKAGLGRAFQATGRGIGRGIGAIISFPFRSPAHLLASAAGVLLGGYTLSRYQDAYGHDAQHDFFRDLTNTKGH